MKNTFKLVAVNAFLAAALMTLASYAASKQLPYSIKHHNLAIELDLAASALKAQDQITFIPQQTGATELDLLLRRGLTVKGVYWGKKSLKFDITEPADPARFEAQLDSEDVSFYTARR